MHHRPLLRYRASIGHGAVEHFVFLSQVLVELELVGDGISNLNAKHEIDERSQACANRAAGKVGTERRGRWVRSAQWDCRDVEGQGASGCGSQKSKTPTMKDSPLMPCCRIDSSNLEHSTP